MKPKKPTRLTFLWRGLLIAVVAVAILLLGLKPGRALFRQGRGSLTGPARLLAAGVIDPLPDSRLARSHPVVFNGEESAFSQYRSERSAREVIAQFEERYGKPVADAPATEGTMVRVVTPAYCMAGGLDSEGEPLGIIAFDEPKSGGSTYFVGSGGRPKEDWRHGDVGGEEVRGIPRPLRSRRVLCVDGLGGITSRLLVYRGFGEIADTVERFATEMPKAGWTRNVHVENIVQKHLPGTFLSFLKGVQRAMIYIERDKESGKVRTAVAYTVKSWLPPDRGI